MIAPVVPTSSRPVPSPVLVRPLRLRAALWFMVAAAVAILMPAMARAQGQVDTRQIYTVERVAVDVTATSATQARDQAMARGQSQAFDRLVRRIVPKASHGSVPPPSADRVQELVQGIEVAGEKTSNVRYIATLTVVFNRSAVRSYLTAVGVPFAETPSRPVLIVPVLSRDAVNLLWEDNNPWRDAWQNLPRQEGLVPLIVPYGDLTDIRDLNTEQALRPDIERLQALARRYGARDSVVARARLAVNVQTNQPMLEITMVRYGSIGGGQTLVESLTGGSAAELTALLDTGVSRVVDEVQDAWKQENMVRPGVVSRVSVVVPIESFERWLSIRKRVDAVSILTKRELIRLSRREAHMDLLVNGDAEQLRIALSQRDLELIEGAPGLVLKEAGRPLPEAYQGAVTRLLVPGTPPSGDMPPGAAPSGVGGSGPLTPPLLPVPPRTN